VAIVQVSRITQRKGLQTDLPQPLASAELGWAVDERRLFIGNGTIAEGAPVVGNTEILTEFSDILGFFTQYTYRGDAAGYTAQTGATPGDPVTQSIQRRLDSYAVITTFGATGDGVTDVTNDINRALFQIYCRSKNPSARRSLFFPAGEYIITDTLNIPPNATLYGEGIDSTIINFKVNAFASSPSQPLIGLIPYTKGTLVKFGGDYYRSIDPVPVGTSIDNVTFWAPETLPEYIFRTADGLQQTGVNISTNNVDAPGKIQVSGIKFKVNQVTNGVLIERASNCSFDNVAIEGPLTIPSLTSTADDTAAVRWNSVGNPEGQICKNVVWNNCTFSGFTFGTVTNQNIRGVTFIDCDFSTLYQGVILGGPTLENGGPTGVRIVQNTFDVIRQEGVVITGAGLNATAYNTFYDVGNNFTGTTSPNNITPASPIIKIDANNNISVGDSFERNNSQSATHPRVALLNGRSSIALGMNVVDVAYVQNTTAANSIDLGTYKQLAGVRDTIDNNTSGNLAIVTNGFGKINAFKIDYTIIRLNSYRTGTLTVVSGTDFSYSDDFVENTATGVTLVAAYNAGPPETVTISYSATNTGQPAIINYSISTLG
jgi:hypothetical protein